MTIACQILASLLAALPNFGRFCETMRADDDPEGLSGITRAQDGHYWCVEDRGGRLHEYVLAQPTNKSCEVSFRLLRSISLPDRIDLEGCAADPLRPDVVWVSDESDSSIRAFNVKDGRELDAVTIPEPFRKKARRNRSFESLAIAPDGKSMWTANEDTLKGDGEPSTKAKGGVVRLQEFTRANGKAEWKPSRQLRYQVDSIGGDARVGVALSGVADLCVTKSGNLLVLERECSRKNPMFPTCRCRIYEVKPGKDGSTATKALRFDENTYFSNYEGMTFGPTLPDGGASLVLVSDAGGGAAANVMILDISGVKEQKSR